VRIPKRPPKTARSFKTNPPTKTGYLSPQPSLAAHNPGLNSQPYHPEKPNHTAPTSAAQGQPRNPQPKRPTARSGPQPKPGQRATGTHTVRLQNPRKQAGPPGAASPLYWTRCPSHIPHAIMPSKPTPTEPIGQNVGGLAAGISTAAGS
jgi:hypothetical protein